MALIFDLPASHVAQARADGLSRQRAGRAAGYAKYGQAGVDHTIWDIEGRLCELATELWLGLPLLPDLPPLAHLDTNEPWAVQVKPYPGPWAMQVVRLRARPGLCYYCPTVFAEAHAHSSLVTLWGWAYPMTIMLKGRWFDYGSGDSKGWEAPPRVLTPMPARPPYTFRREHSACPVVRRRS